MSFLEHQLNLVRDSFNRESKQFQYMMEHGGGVNNLHMYSTLHNLQWLYQRIAALEEANRLRKDKP